MRLAVKSIGKFVTRVEKNSTENSRVSKIPLQNVPSKDRGISANEAKYIPVPIPIRTVKLSKVTISGKKGGESI